MAGGDADQLPDHPQPPPAPRGTGVDPGRRAGAELLQEDDLDLEPRAAEDRAEPPRHPLHEPPARGPPGHRPTPGAYRRGRGAEARDQGRRTPGYGLRPRHDRPADPR